MDKLRERVNKEGLSVAEIAKVLGITAQSVRNKLQGKTEWTASQAVTLAAMLGCRVEELF